MARILFWVLIVFLVWFVVRWVGASRKRGDSVNAAQGTSRVAPADAARPMAQCAWCGAHMPAQDALALDDGRVYCSAPHREAAIRADQESADATHGRDA